MTTEHNLRNEYQVLLISLASKTLSPEQEDFVSELIRDQMEREIACIPDLEIVEVV